MCLNIYTPTLTLFANNPCFFFNLQISTRKTVALRTTTQSQMSRTWMRAGQAGMYSTGKGSSGAGDDDMLDAMMAGMESDFTVPTPTSETTNAESTMASSEGSADPEPTFVATPVDLEKRLKALSKFILFDFFVVGRHLLTFLELISEQRRRSRGIEQEIERGIGRCAARGIDSRKKLELKEAFKGEMMH